MNKELIDRAWRVLPKEFKEKVKEIYLNAVVPHPCGYSPKIDLLKYLFGHHNLTSDAEEEEMLIISRKEVQEQYQMYRNMGMIKRLDALMRLFGSKCLPDEEPKPAETKNEGTRQEQYVPKNAESSTHLDSIANNDFRDHNRLHIAAMIAQGIMANSNPQMVDMKVERIVDLAILTADALIKKVEGGSK